MKTSILMISAGFLLSLSATSAQAQISDYDLNSSNMEIRAGFAIPFGGDGQAKNEKPQLQLSLRNYNTTETKPFSWALSSTGERNFHEHKFALTLDEQPAFLINNREVVFDEEQMNLSTTETILVGGAVLLVVMAVSYVEDCKDDPFC